VNNPVSGETVPLTITFGKKSSHHTRQYPSYKLSCYSNPPFLTPVRFTGFTMECGLDYWAARLQQIPHLAPLTLSSVPDSLCLRNVLKTWLIPRPANLMLSSTRNLFLAQTQLGYIMLSTA
jgi:hypothetical protein